MTTVINTPSGNSGGGGWAVAEERALPISTATPDRAIERAVRALEESGHRVLSVTRAVEVVEHGVGRGGQIVSEQRPEA